MSRKAFTLIEMLVIIIIIAVMASVLAPNWSRFWSRTRFDVAVSGIQDAFRTARQRAITSDAPATLSFDARSQTLVISGADTPNMDMPAALQTPQQQPSAEDSEPREIGDTVMITAFDAGNSMSGGPPAVMFYPDGTSDPAKVVVSSEAGYTAVLSLRPASGQLILEPGQ